MDHIRHSALFDASDLVITLIGGGGIGGPTAFALAKMGVGMLEIFDDDIVSEENLATQFFGLSDVGKPKPVALKEIIAQFSDDTEVIPVCVRVTASDPLPGTIIISAVDSISSRKGIWEAIKGRFNFYIDARMGAERAEIFVVTPEKSAMYESLLEITNDEDIADVPCTAKATVFCGLGIASFIGELVRKVASDQPLPMVVAYDFPTFIGTKA